VAPKKDIIAAAIAGRFPELGRWRSRSRSSASETGSDF
jgi:hypothetical protein